MKINENEYKLPELNFNAMCRLEDMGVSLVDMDKRVLSTVRGFLALAMDDDMERAGVEIEEHLSNGGSLESLMEDINRAVSESGFFRSLAAGKATGNRQSEEKKNAQE